MNVVYRELERDGMVATLVDSRLYYRLFEECSGTAIYHAASFALDAWLKAMDALLTDQEVVGIITRAFRILAAEVAAQNNPPCEGEWEFLLRLVPLSCAAFEGSSADDGRILLGFLAPMHVERSTTLEAADLMLAIEFSGRWISENLDQVTMRIRLMDEEEEEFLRGVTREGKL